MQLDFTNLFGSSDEVINIDYNIDFADFEYGAYHPLKDGVTVSGRAYCKADVVHMELDISFTFHGICDRCMDEFEQGMAFSADKIIVRHLENEDEHFDDYIIVEHDKLDLDALVEEEINLHLPSKLLCKEDCKGLCTHCGANLNYEKCDCKQEVDPRMAALLQLLDED